MITWFNTVEWMWQTWTNRRKVNFRETREKCFLYKVIREETLYELFMRFGIEGHTWYSYNFVIYVTDLLFRYRPFRLILH